MQSHAGVYNSSDFNISGPSVLCRNSTASYSPTYIGSDILDYKWGWSSGFNYQSGQGTPYLGVGTNFSFNGGTIVLQLKNRCGYTGSPVVKFVGSGSCGFSVTASPNPASSSLQLVVSSDASATDQSSSLTPSVIPTLKASLVNSNNLEVWLASISESILNIDVSNIPNGIYYLKVSDGQVYVSKRIVIKH